MAGRSKGTALRPLLGVLCGAVCVTIALFAWLLVRGREGLATAVKPCVVWEMAAFFAVCGRRWPVLRPLAARAAGAFVLYGVGDVVMELGTALTPLGIVLFLCGHALYYLAIRRSSHIPSEQSVALSGTQKQRTVAAVLVCVLLEVGTTAAVLGIGSASGQYAVAVLAWVYAQLFVATAAAALRRWRRPLSCVLTALGALLYAASDTCVAAERYLVSRWWMRPFVMSTYWLAVACYAAAVVPLIAHAAAATITTTRAAAAANKQTKQTKQN